MNEKLQDHFRGALLGTFVGDALGVPVEMQRRHTILENNGGEVREMLPARLGKGKYSDDTELMIGLAEGLLEGAGEARSSRLLDLDTIATCFANNFDDRRGYGGNAIRVLAAIKIGVPWPKATASFKPPGGSYGNGAAMRVAPVALAFYSDESKVVRAAERQSAVTGHTHELGSFGAKLQALAVHRAIQQGVAGQPFEGEAFLRDRSAGSPPDYQQRLTWIADNVSATPEAVINEVGVGVPAHEAVPAALWAVLSCPDDPEEAIVKAVNLGGDTDTIGAMAGAIVGAYHGASKLPSRWVDVLENREKGKDHVLQLADRLLKLHA